jgi:GTP-binding protein Era
VSFHSGFGCLVGRPNVGKSTLLNALVGQKVAITGRQPQTTRQAVRGVVNRADAQLVLVDTPGLHRPRTLLGERLNDVARGSLAGVDVVGFCLPADQPVGPGDRFIAAELARLRQPVVAVVTKADLAGRAALGAALVAAGELGDWADVVPVSARTGWQLDTLADLLVAKLPEGPAYFADGEPTDQPVETLVAELIREAALAGAREELPHSIAVRVEEMARRSDRELVDVHAVVYVERPSQQAIVVGAGGARLKETGTRARRQIEALLGSPVYLDLRVKVARDWQRDPRELRRLGF